MKSEEVGFWSGGVRVAATWRTPDSEGPHRAVVQGPGWLGLRDAALYEPYHRALTDAGIAVLIVDYRGFGDSEGDSEVLSFIDQVEDLRAGVTYLTTRNDVDSDAIGTFGSGGSGGGNSVILAALDPRIKAVVAQVPVADGYDWLKRTRPDHEWLTFLQELDEDDRAVVNGAQSRLVDPREELTIPTPERRATSVKQDVDKRVGRRVRLSCARELLRYNPLGAAAGLTTPLMVISVEGDTMTPAEHAKALYEAAAGPKRLVVQRHTSHYAAYSQYGDRVIPLIADWLDRYVRPSDLIVTESG